MCAAQLVRCNSWLDVSGPTWKVNLSHISCCLWPSMLAFQLGWHGNSAGALIISKSVKRHKQVEWQLRWRIEKKTKKTEAVQKRGINLTLQAKVVLGIIHHRSIGVWCSYCCAIIVHQRMSLDCLNVDWLLPVSFNTTCRNYPLSWFSTETTFSCQW